MEGALGLYAESVEVVQCIASRDRALSWLLHFVEHSDLESRIHVSFVCNKMHRKQQDMRCKRMTNVENTVAFALTTKSRIQTVPSSRGICFCPPL